jgi:hypothetical protein
MREAKQKISRTRSDKDPIKTLLISSPGKAVQSAAATKSSRNRIDGAIILWSTFFGSAVTSVAFFALGYAHSPHIQGSTSDPDFWFLAQGCITQILGLAASALLEWKSGNLPKWRWVLPTGIAGLCSITAAPLYVVAPTEWSSFLALVASAAQSFMILQHFLSGSPS